MNIGNKLIALRAEKKMSQSELAELLDVSRQTVSKWECNISDPEIGRITQIALIFNVTTDYLLDNSVDSTVMQTNITNNKTEFKLKRTSKQILLFWLVTILVILFTFIYCYELNSFTYVTDGVMRTGIMAHILGRKEVGYTGITSVSISSILTIVSTLFTIKTFIKCNK